jgi:hypothetical protein
MARKHCSTCGDLKPLAQFHRDRRAPDGRRRCCKTCACAATKRWDDAHPAQVIARKRRHQPVKGTRPRYASVEERFWAKVHKNSGCWEWTAALSTGGYGRLGVNGQSLAAHRLAWQFTIGPVPEGLCVLHRCDNRRCVRPGHLYLGTYRDNARDREMRGRSHDRSGMHNGRARFTEDQVREIRRLAETMPQYEVANRFDTTQARVSEMVRRTTWAHVK